MLTRIAPTLAVAYWTSTHSAQLGDQIPTRSPFAEPGREQPGRDAVDGRVELRVGQPHVLVAGDHRVAVAEARGRALEVGADRLAEQAASETPWA